MVIGDDKAIGGGRPEMESTISAFSANETALDSSSVCYYADKHQNAASPEFDLTQRKAAAQVDAKGKYEPCLSEHGIPSDVLAKLLPGDDIVELVEPKVNGGLIFIVSRTPAP